MAERIETLVGKAHQELRGIDWEVMKKLKWERIRRFVTISQHSQSPPVSTRYLEVPEEIREVLRLVYVPGFKIGLGIGKNKRHSVIEDVVKGIDEEWFGPSGVKNIYVEGVRNGFKFGRLIVGRRLRIERY